MAQGATNGSTTNTETGTLKPNFVFSQVWYLEGEEYKLKKGDLVVSEGGEISFGSKTLDGAVNQVRSDDEFEILVLPAFVNSNIDFSVIDNEFFTEEEKKNVKIEFNFFFFFFFELIQRFFFFKKKNREKWIT